MTKTVSTENSGLGTRFNQVRRTLLQDRYVDRLGKPLEYWVLPSDRRLPLALLGRTIGELLSTPFEELSATPGIGEKKINSLVKLLDRATHDEPPTVSVGEDDSSALIPGDSSAFDASIVSEALWTEWREMVRCHDIADRRLGQLAPSLQRLPTVIWNKPLADYLDHSVAEIRSLRTHGEKRVRCVLEVFHSVYQRLTEGSTDDMDLLLTPGHIRDVKDWVKAQLLGDAVPDEEEVRKNFSAPLMALIDNDCGTTVSGLVEERLGLSDDPSSVREQARRLGVTRARVYQLLDDCGKVMSVRWPEGKEQLDRLTSHYSALKQRQGHLRLFFGLCELCFPEKQSALSPEESNQEGEASSPADDRAPENFPPSPDVAKAKDSVSESDPSHRHAERGDMRLTENTDAAVRITISSHG